MVPRLGIWVNRVNIFWDAFKGKFYGKWMRMDVGAGAPTLKYIISFMMSMVLWSLLRLADWRWDAHVVKMEDSDPTKNVLCTTPRGNGDKRRDRQSWGGCDDVQDDARLVAEIGELLRSEERSGGKSFWRPRRTKGYCNNGKRKSI